MDDVSVKSDQMHTCACVCTAMLYIIGVVVCITRYQEIIIQLVIITGGQVCMVKYIRLIVKG